MTRRAATQCTVGRARVGLRVLMDAQVRRCAAQQASSHRFQRTPAGTYSRYTHENGGDRTGGVGEQLAKKNGGCLGVGKARWEGERQEQDAVDPSSSYLPHTPHRA
jgi:hypothetical protein